MEKTDIRSMTLEQLETFVVQDLKDKKFVKERAELKLRVLDMRFRKIDPSGRISMIYDSIPSQLALGRKSFVLSSAINKRVSNKDEELFEDIGYNALRLNLKAIPKDTDLNYLNKIIVKSADDFVKI